MVVGEFSPTLLAAGPIAPECTRSFTVGVPAEDEGRAYTTACGCGHPMAARTVHELQAAFKAHVRYRRAQ